MKYAGITNKVLKRFAKKVPDKGKFALKDVSEAKNHAERSALARFLKVGIMAKTGYGIYQRTSTDPVKDYYARRRKGFERRGAPGVSKRRTRIVDAPNIRVTLNTRVTPWGNDGNYLINIGNKQFLGTEVALVPVKKGNGANEN